MALKYEFDHENFNYFFIDKAVGLRPSQWDTLPRELFSKIRKKGYRINSRSTSKLSFLEKLMVLKLTGKRFILLVEDEENGMTPEDFFKYKNEILKKRKYTEATANELLEIDVFALANEELIETFDRINKLCTGAAYNYLMKVKTKNYFKPNEYKIQMKFIAKWINNYEALRKKFIIGNGLSVAEWITLTYLYDGEERNGSILYREKFKGSFNTSATKIKQSFGTLQEKGFIVKYGNGQGTKLQITTLGKSKLTGIFEKEVVKC